MYRPASREAWSARTGAERRPVAPLSVGAGQSNAGFRGVGDTGRTDANLACQSQITASPATVLVRRHSLLMGGGTFTSGTSCSLAPGDVGSDSPDAHVKRGSPD